MPQVEETQLHISGLLVTLTAIWFALFFYWEQKVTRNNYNADTKI